MYFTSPKGQRPVGREYVLSGDVMSTKHTGRNPPGTIPEPGINPVNIGEILSVLFSCPMLAIVT